MVRGSETYRWCVMVRVIPKLNVPVAIENDGYLSLKCSLVLKESKNNTCSIKSRKLILKSTKYQQRDGSRTSSRGATVCHIKFSDSQEEINFSQARDAVNFKLRIQHPLSVNDYDIYVPLLKRKTNKTVGCSFSALVRANCT